MKKLITLFTIFLGLGIANAQEKKPTKEETIEYIVGTLMKLDYYNEKGGATESRSIKNVKFSDCNLFVEYYSRINYNPLTSSINYESYQKIIIPINKIEKISNLYSNTINFQSYNNTDAITIDENRVDFAKNETKESNYQTSHIMFFYRNEEVSTKLVKAFNHLRKLCGAPEPLSFD